MIFLFFLFSLYLDDFLNIGVKSNSGPGQIAIALPVDGYQNPAASSILNSEFSIYGVSLFSGMEFYGAFGGIVKKENQGFSFYLIRFYSSDIPDTRNALNDGNNNGEVDIGEGILPDSVKYFSISDNAVVVNYSEQIFKNTSLGISAKGIYRNLYLDTGYRLGLDIGLHYFCTPNFSLGFVVKNIFSTPEYFSSDKLYSKRRFIFGFGGKKRKKEWLVSSEEDFFFDNNNSISETFRISGEYKKTFSILAGVSENFIFLGAGFNYNQLKIDYTLNIHTYLPATNLISITYYPE